MAEIGDRVRIGALTAAGSTGTIVGEDRRFGVFRWKVALDSPWLGRSQISVAPRSVSVLDASSDLRFEPGQTVEVLTGLLAGKTGRLVKPGHVLWKRAWLIEFGGSRLGLRKTRIAERVLRPVDHPAPPPPPIAT